MLRGKGRCGTHGRQQAMSVYHWLDGHPGLAWQHRLPHKAIRCRSHLSKNTTRSGEHHPGTSLNSGTNLGIMATGPISARSARAPGNDRHLRKRDLSSTGPASSPGRDSVRDRRAQVAGASTGRVEVEPRLKMPSVAFLVHRGDSNPVSRRKGTLLKISDAE